ncbi:MAG: hypothetical protein HZB38_19295 [Planctomycetes bacterium]|nr:hypothetical protein [Planctomycetota bacterium]
MRKLLPRLTAAALTTAVIVLFALPALGERLAPPGGDDAAKARTIVQLIQQGQAGLAEACGIAEADVHGKALRAECEIMQGKLETAPSAKPPEKGPQEPKKPDAAAQHLMYDICCYANDTLLVVRVDGLTKKVVNVKERTTIDESPKPAPKPKG